MTHRGKPRAPGSPRVAASLLDGKHATISPFKTPAMPSPKAIPGLPNDCFATIFSSYLLVVTPSPRRAHGSPRLEPWSGPR